LDDGKTSLLRRTDRPGRYRLATVACPDGREFRITAKPINGGGRKRLLDVRYYQHNGQMFVPTEDGFSGICQSIEQVWEIIERVTSEPSKALTNQPKPE